MRIGLLIYGSLDTLSGGYLYDRKLVEDLAGAGEHVEILSLPWRNYLSLLSDNFSPLLIHRLEDLSLDILLQDELNHPSLFHLNRRLKKKQKIKIISIVHHLLSSEPRPEWQNRFYRRVERRYLESVDGFIFNSQTTRAVVKALAGNLRPALVAYPAGDRLKPAISDDQITRRAGQPGPLRLFSLGNLIPRKGLHVLIDALRRLPHQDWQLSVAGKLDIDKSYARKVFQQAANAGLTDKIRFWGALGKAELSTHLNHSHLLVLPSLYEGYGIAYLEGMGFGLPAIASTAGAAREIITHGVDGFLIPPGDSDVLAQHLMELQADRERLASMARSARRRFLAHPTWEETTARIRAFLRALDL